jgi:hypothetical protein
LKVILFFLFFSEAELKKENIEHFQFFSNNIVVRCHH